jgi:hypothetical protein
MEDKIRNEKIHTPIIEGVEVVAANTLPKNSG